MPAVTELHGVFPVDRGVGEVFELFSPLGEARWAPGWSPELLYPPGVSWERGLLFRTQGERGEVLWLVSDLDRTHHRVEYHRVEPGRHIARVTVRCVSLEGARTEVHVSYVYVGLSEAGNAEVAGMTPDAHDARLRQWKGWIDDATTR